MMEAITSFFNMIVAIMAGIVLSLLTALGIFPTEQTVVVQVPLAQDEAPMFEDAPSVAQEEPVSTNTEAPPPPTPKTPTAQDIANTIARVQETLRSIAISSPSPADSEAVNKEAREALVNIFCTAQTTAGVRSISGSGIIIDPRGVILTNAHIAQYMLIEHYPYHDAISCVIRNGAPAKIAYDATLLYISPSWIKENAHTIVEESPTGTGEHDFALLLINKSLSSGTPLPTSFPFVGPDVSEENLYPGRDILLASYPAGFLGGSTIQKELWPASAETTIKNIYTFASGSADLISVGGTIISQKGSSGSGVIDIVGNRTIGIIVTSSNAEQTSERELNAITLAHINNSVVNDIGTSLAQFLSGNLVNQASSFNKTLVPTLRALLIQELEK